MSYDPIPGACAIAAMHYQVAAIVYKSQGNKESTKRAAALVYAFADFLHQDSRKQCIDDIFSEIGVVGSERDDIIQEGRDRVAVYIMERRAMFRQLKAGMN